MLKEFFENREKKKNYRMKCRKEFLDSQIELEKLKVRQGELKIEAIETGRQAIKFFLQMCLENQHPNSMPFEKKYADEIHEDLKARNQEKG